MRARPGTHLAGRITSTQSPYSAALLTTPGKNPSSPALRSRRRSSPVAPAHRRRAHRDDLTGPERASSPAARPLKPLRVLISGDLHRLALVLLHSSSASPSMPNATIIRPHHRRRSRLDHLRGCRYPGRQSRLHDRARWLALHRSGRASSRRVKAGQHDAGRRPGR